MWQDSYILSPHDHRPGCIYENGMATGEITMEIIPCIQVTVVKVLCICYTCVHIDCTRMYFRSRQEFLMEQIEDCLSFYLGKAYQRVTQSAKQRLAPYGVTPVQYALLKVLWERDQQSGAELGERLLLDSATMTGLLDRLEHGGLIERKAHATDRRVNMVALTARGRELQVPLDREMDQMNQDLLGEFSADERKLLRSLLTSISGRKQTE